MIGAGIMGKGAYWPAALNNPTPAALAASINAISCVAIGSCKRRASSRSAAS